MAPTLTCLGPAAPQSSSFVTATWDYQPDPATGEAQDSVDVRIFTVVDTLADSFDPSAGAPVVAVTKTDPGTSLVISKGLPAGDFVAYMEATDAGGVASGWCLAAFSVTALPTANRPPATAVGQLGCGRHTARIQDRGGGVTRAEIEWQSLSYGFRLDDTSDARMTIGAVGMAGEVSCLALSALRAWQHELAILRNDDEAWVGVVGDPEFTSDGVTVPARDLFQWMDRRNLEHDRNFVGADLAVVFRQYVEDALERDASPNITVQVYGAGATGDRSVLASARKRAADELRDLARSGVDFTMQGRTMLVGGPELPVPALPLLTTEMIDGAKLTPSGLNGASEVVVVGATAPNQQSSDPQAASSAQTAPFSGVAGGVDSDIGLVQTTVNDSNLQSDNACAQSASSRLALLGGVPEFLTATLVPDTPVQFSDLVPGARWPVAARVGCRTIEGVHRLSAVDVTAQASDSGVTEAVVVTLEPLGTTDGMP